MSKNFAGLLLAAITFFWGTFAMAQMASSKRAKGPEVFQQMARYEGQWKVSGNQNQDLSITFDVAANDTVLVETWRYKGKTHALTLYTLNQDQLMATHYCPHGNQPTLVMNSDVKKNLINFKFQSAAGLSDVDKAYLRQLSFELDGTEKLKRSEVYATPAGDKSSQLVLERLSAPAPGA